MSRKSITKYWITYGIVAILLIVFAITFWSRVISFPKQVKEQISIQHGEIIQQNEDLRNMVFSLQNQISDLQTDITKINSEVQHTKSVEEVISMITGEMYKENDYEE